jgi:hypothetical protein
MGNFFDLYNINFDKTELDYVLSNKKQISMMTNMTWHKLFQIIIIFQNMTWDYVKILTML